MVEKMYRCTTCNVDVITKKYWVKFLCPACGEALIVRCSTCKGLSSKYTCPKCKFTGP
ncbi:MAG: zinc finger domain-containing protein [Candidatus Aenigmarchaeota archaeon]|nr:zinc finger domain-containing protein [Candidatus Aenigmarchaeota archaeon]